MNYFTGRVLVAATLLIPVLLSAIPVCLAESDTAKRIQAGKELAFDRQKGNCLACHVVEDGESPGTIAPPLIAMKARYPDRARLKEQISDARIANPLTMMPPFGPHAILTEDEIDLIVDYIRTL